MNIEKNEVLNLIQRADNFEDNRTKKLISDFQKLRKKRQEFYLTSDELEQILKWKLDSQFGRQKKIRENNTPDNVKIITKAAFAVTHTNKDFEIVLKLKILSTLTGVEIPVASAILTICYPEQFAVIDFRNWRQVYQTEKQKTYYTAKEYLGYLHKVREYAKKYGITPQEMDIALWQKDREENGKSTISKDLT